MGPAGETAFLDEVVADGGVDGGELLQTSHAPKDKAASVPDVLRVLQPLWIDKTETASRLRGRIEAVLSWAKGNGYIGYGLVTSETVPASEFMTADGPLFDQPLAEPRFKRADEPAEHAEHAVGIEWLETVETNQAKWFKGGFANQNIVCKLRDEATVDFLTAEFGVERRT